jgi:4-diphosphocytidyl-2-C-methyl-D-erythritol kinase
MEAGAALKLDKHLPVASGIGGGSADAAAALRLLRRWWGIGADPDGMSAIARELGSDVPACLASITARGEGRGDFLSPLDLGLSGTPLLLVNPGVPVATGTVFRAWDGVDRGPLGELPGRNDLEAPAIAAAPVVGEVLARLRGASGTTLVRMSGSGATCFALFENERQRNEARASIGDQHPDWWIMASRLR